MDFSFGILLMLGTMCYIIDIRLEEIRDAISRSKNGR